MERRNGTETGHLFVGYNFCSVTKSKSLSKLRRIGFLFITSF